MSKGLPTSLLLRNFFCISVVSVDKKATADPPLLANPNDSMSLNFLIFPFVRLMIANESLGIFSVFVFLIRACLMTLNRGLIVQITKRSSAEIRALQPRGMRISRPFRF